MLIILGAELLISTAARAQITIEGNPSCASSNDGKTDMICAVKGTNVTLYGIRISSNGASTGYQALGGAPGGMVQGSPSCASPNDGTGQVICAVKGGDHALYGIRFDPGTGYNSGYQTLGGFIEGDPSCATPEDGSGQVICATKGGPSALYGIRFNPATGYSTGHVGLGGFIEGQPSCTS
ncbi:MAG: hypothetical protein JO217_05410, partial [Acidobacteriaceae bacterium]|nr:hypothetical protein [Acidobacteriaceae bacterium]